MTSTASQVRFLLKHSSIYGIGNLLSKAVAFLLLPLYTNYLDPTAYGTLELLEATSSMIGLVIGFGMSAAMTRFYFDFENEAQRRELVSTVFIVVIVANIFVLGAASTGSELLARVLLGSESLANFFYLSFFSLGIGVLLDLFQTYLRIKQQSSVYVAISLLNLIISVTLNIYFVAYKQVGVIGILYATAITRLLLTLPLITGLFLKIGIRFKKKLARELIDYCMPLIPAEAANTAVSYSDRYFINYFLSTAAAGIYGLSQKFGTMLHILVTSPFILAFMPIRFDLGRREDAPKLFAVIFDVYMGILVTLTLGLCIFAGIAVELLTDERFHSASKYIPLAAATMIIVGMKYHFQFGILYAKKTKQIMIVNVISLIVHLVANISLIEYFGLWGALLAGVLASSTTTGLYLWLSQREYPIPFRFSRNILLVAVAGCAYSASLMFGDLPIFERAAVDTLIMVLFAGALLALRLVNLSDLQRIRRETASPEQRA